MYIDGQQIKSSSFSGLHQVHGHVGSGLLPGRDGVQPADLPGQELPRPDPQDHRHPRHAHQARLGIHREPKGEGLI